MLLKLRLTRASLHTAISFQNASHLRSLGSNHLVKERRSLRLNVSLDLMPIKGSLRFLAIMSSWRLRLDFVRFIFLRQLLRGKMPLSKNLWRSIQLESEPCSPHLSKSMRRNCVSQLERSAATNGAIWKQCSESKMVPLGASLQRVFSGTWEASGMFHH